MDSHHGSSTDLSWSQSHCHQHRYGVGIECENLWSGKPVFFWPTYAANLQFLFYPSLQRDFESLPWSAGWNSHGDCKRTLQTWRHPDDFLIPVHCVLCNFGKWFSDEAIIIKVWWNSCEAHLLNLYSHSQVLTIKKVSQHSPHHLSKLCLNLACTFSNVEHSCCHRQPWLSGTAT